MRAVYLLHFDEPISHARHYLGGTWDLLARLKQHANGQGSALTRELYSQGIGWTVARVWSCPKQWSLEQLLKKMKASPDFCPICNPEHTRNPPIGVEYPLLLTRSEDFK